MNHIDTIAHAIASFVNGESAPPLMSAEFATIISALASIKPDEFHTIGTHAELLAYIAAWAPGPKEGQGP